MRRSDVLLGNPGLGVGLFACNVQSGLMDLEDQAAHLLSVSTAGMVLLKSSLDVYRAGLDPAHGSVM